MLWHEPAPAAATRLGHEPGGEVGCAHPRQGCAPIAVGHLTETSNFSYVTPTNAPQDDILPFSAAWQAREDALDARLRRTMDICRGC